MGQMTLVEPDPFRDAVLGAGGRGNYFRQHSIYRQLICKHAPGYSNITPSDWAQKRAYVADHVIHPILEKGGRFLVIDKSKPGYYQLNLEDEKDGKMAIKAVQQAMRDEMKKRGRSGMAVATAKEGAPAALKKKTTATPTQKNAPTIHNMMMMMMATTNPTMTPSKQGGGSPLPDRNNGNNNSNQNQDANGIYNYAKRKKLQLPNKRSSNLVLPTQKNLNTGNNNGGEKHSSPSFASSENRTGTQAPPVSHIPSSLPKIVSNQQQSNKDKQNPANPGLHNRYSYPTNGMLMYSNHGVKTRPNATIMQLGNGSAGSDAHQHFYHHAAAASQQRFGIQQQYQLQQQQLQQQQRYQHHLQMQKRQLDIMQCMAAEQANNNQNNSKNDKNNEKKNPPTTGVVSHQLQQPLPPKEQQQQQQPPPPPPPPSPPLPLSKEQQQEEQKVANAEEERENEEITNDSEEDEAYLFI